MTRNYVVIKGRGRLLVSVSEEVIKLRGERNAVAQAAWFKLMGQNALGEDVDKKLPTRKILMDELLSTYEPYRHRVYDTFVTSIEFKLVSYGK